MPQILSLRRSGHDQISLICGNSDEQTIQTGFFKEIDFQPEDLLWLLDLAEQLKKAARKEGREKNISMVRT